MRKSLKNGDAVFGAVSRMPKRCKRQPVRRAIAEIKLAVGIKILVLGINELGFGGRDHADKFVPCAVSSIPQAVQWAKIAPVYIYDIENVAEYCDS